MWLHQYNKNYPYLTAQLQPYKPALFSIGLMLALQIFLTVALPVPLRILLNRPLQGQQMVPLAYSGFYFGTYPASKALLFLALFTLLFGLLLMLTSWIEQMLIG